ncbi:MAG: ABC transporter ATP-binding protein [Xanthobacteraceae bacterium]
MIGKGAAVAEVRFVGVEKSYGDQPAVRGIDLTVQPGEFVTLLGPSGCGKTTCLRMVAGFVAPSRGRIIMGGRDITALPPYRRNTGMVFQSYALFPHKTVAENIAFGLRVRRLPRAEREQRIAEVLRLVHLDQFAFRYPAQLSGGQRQRVALARAIVIRPDVLLLDEPLAALDLKLREELQVEIKRVQSALKITTLFVTHDQGEALSMSDRVAVMQDGRIVQIDTPEALYERPNCRYVANFVGRTNLLDVVVREKLDGNLVRVESSGATKASFVAAAGPVFEAQVGDRCLLGARPEHFHLGGGRANTMQAKVRSVTYLGSIRYVDTEGPDGENVTVQAQPGEPLPGRGETVTITWRPQACFLIKE